MTEENITGNRIETESIEYNEKINDESAEYVVFDDPPIRESEEEKKVKIKKLLNIKERISQLNKYEYCEIYKIIKKYDEPFSVNKNGIMFDLVKLGENTVKDISVFLNYLREKNNQIINDEFNRYKYKELLN